MINKKCIICQKEFDCRTNAICCSKECSKINERQKSIANGKKYRQRPQHKEYHRIRSGIWRRKNRVKVNSTMTNWRNKNREKVRKYGRDRYAVNKSRQFKYTKRYRNLIELQKIFGTLKCLRCSYDKDIVVLDCHHITEDEKICLCSNCHRLVTYDKVRIIKENNQYRFIDTNNKLQREQNITTKEQLDNDIK